MALPTTSSQHSVRSRASSPSRRELRRILSDPDAVGRAFWVWASPDEAIFAAAAEHSSAALSDRMQRRKEQILSASSTGDYEKFGRKRVCILVTAQKKISEQDLIAFIPTTTLNHGAFALESADKYIQALAVAIDDTPPWPTADSPTVNMVPKWEATPCYALARVIDVSVARVVAIHIPESRIANLSALLDLAEDRVEALRKLSSDQATDLKNSYDSAARRRKSKRGKSKGASKISKNVQSARISFSTNLLSIPEGEAVAVGDYGHLIAEQVANLTLSTSPDLSLELEPTQTQRSFTANDRPGQPASHAGPANHDARPRTRTTSELASHRSVRQLFKSAVDAVSHHDVHKSDKAAEINAPGPKESLPPKPKKDKSKYFRRLGAGKAG